MCYHTLIILKIKREKICKLITIVSSSDSRNFKIETEYDVGKGKSEKNSLLENIFQTVQLQGNGGCDRGVQ